MVFSSLSGGRCGVPDILTFTNAPSYPDLSLSQIWRSICNIETITILSFLGALNFWCYLPWASSKPSEFTYHYAMQRETRGIKVFPLCCGYLICQLCQLLFTILKFIDLWFFSYFISKLHTAMASPFWSYCVLLSSAKNDKLDFVIISLTSLKNLWLVNRYWKRVYLKTDSSNWKRRPVLFKPSSTLRFSYWFIIFIITVLWCYRISLPSYPRSPHSNP